MKKNRDVKINGLDLDSWLDVNEIQQSTSDESTLKYDKKLVAFLDLLGITELIRAQKDGEEGEIIARMEKIKGIVEIEAKECIENNSLFLLHISDSFIFSCPGGELPHLLNLLSIVQMRILLECKTLLRGAIEYGSVNVNDDGRQIIGPAYIDAYIKQERDALYPRIIVSNTVIDLIQAQFPDYSNVIMTYDREKALDYVSAYVSREGTNNTVTSRLKRDGVFDFLVSNYEEFDKENKPSIRRKYGWTINYFKDKEVWPSEKKYNNW